MSVKRSIPLGRIWGIPLGLDYSWFFVFALVSWSLATAYFPSQYPGWSTPLYWSIGVVTSLLFFASVVLHELGHSLLARLNGIPVRSITLFIFGGVAQIEKEPESPVVEFFIALAGPAVSFLLALLFGLLGRIAGITTPLLALATYLAYINGSLALFNLIPGFPLDGGRVLRAAIWQVTGSFRRATEIAGMIGHLFAWLFIAGGIWLAFAGNWGNGLWLIFIGWFLENAATAAVQQVALEQLLSGHHVDEIMSANSPTLAPNVTLEEVVDHYILSTGRRCFPVAHNGHIDGLLTVHNVKEIPRDRWPTTTVQETMTPMAAMHIVHPDDSLWAAVKEMTTDDVNQLPVVDPKSGRLVGILARDNVLSFVRTLSEVSV